VKTLRIHCGGIQHLKKGRTLPGSRILIFNPFRIPDPKTATTERGGKKYDGIPFYVATKLYFILVLKS
jgi:hypothetical protein